MCKWEGCDRPVRYRGYCSRCYQRAQAQGVITTTPNTGRSRIMDTGYVRVWAPDHPLAKRDGYVLEHRMVAWDAGLFTDPSLHVHHVNGDRTDNRIENLRPMDESAHHSHHMADGRLIVNQYGSFPRKPEFCVVEGCGLATFRGELCSKHSTRMARHGTLDIPTRAERMRRRALRGVDPAELVRRYDGGEHPSRIAEATGVKAGTVRNVLREHGFELKVGRPVTSP